MQDLKHNGHMFCQKIAVFTEQWMNIRQNIIIYIYLSHGSHSERNLGFQHIITIFQDKVYKI